MKYKSLEMKYLVSCVTLNLLFLANFVSSEQQLIFDTTKYEFNITDSNGQRIHFYDIKLPIHMSCNVTDSLKVQWRKEGTPLTDIDSFKGRVSFSSDGKVTIKDSRAEDSGNYSCVALDDDQVKDSITMTLSARPAVKIAENQNIVEGETLEITCIVLGNPMPIVSWRVGNKSLNSSDERIKYSTDPDTNVNNTVLTITDMQLSDRDTYTCTARSPYSDLVFRERNAVVRVKDNLAALWPFLGICAEVFVLCAIILVYEKKRNKTELDESDTDQSPDQKNTPDHGKDSDVRHRK